MKPLLLLLALTTFAFAGGPAKKVINRQFEDGTGSSKTVDPEKMTAEEVFMDARGKVTHKVTYLLDEHQKEISALFYTAAGALSYKATYKRDGADRIVQEIVTDPNGKLLYTRNYNYGSRNGRSIVLSIDLYDDQNRLVPPPAKGKGKAKR